MHSEELTTRRQYLLFGRLAIAAGFVLGMPLTALGFLLGNLQGYVCVAGGLAALLGFTARGSMLLRRGRTMPDVVGRTALAPDDDDPRWRDAPEAKQVAGRTCVQCNRRVLLATEGAACSTCDAVVHTACLAMHERDAHTNAPFR